VVQIIDFDSGIATIAEARVGFRNVRESSSVIKGFHTTDFVWAVRLSKIHKSFLRKKWSKSTYTKRATFTMEEDEFDVAAVLRDEFTVIQDEALGEALVILPEPET
jgi:hypothetical protein